MVWILAVAIGIIVASPYVEPLRSFEIPWTYLGVMLLFFLPAYGFIAALTVAIGASVNEVQQGQQISGMLSVLIMAPIFLLVLLFSNPSHPAFIFMTFFPPTAFMSVSLRWGLVAIPAWQLGLSWVLLMGGTVLMIWIAARLFRAGMLRYGQPLSWKSALAALRSA
jgi:ABC-2 type transport system permease protein